MLLLTKLSTVDLLLLLLLMLILNGCVDSFITLIFFSCKLKEEAVLQSTNLFPQMNHSVDISMI